MECRPKAGMAPFRFRRLRAARRGDWTALRATDPERVVARGDVEAVVRLLDKVAFVDFDPSSAWAAPAGVLDGELEPGETVDPDPELKALRVAQFSTQYLMHSVQVRGPPSRRRLHALPFHAPAHARGRP